MNIEQAIYQLLKTDAAITALVAGRIFSGIWKQEVTTYPGIVYRPPPDGGREHVRVLENGIALVRQRIEVFSAGRKYRDATATDEAVIERLDEFRGTVSNTDLSPIESIDIQGIFLSEPAHAYQFDDKTQLHEFKSVFDCYFLDPSRID